jgi:hypothetical protein
MNGALFAAATVEEAYSSGRTWSHERPLSPPSRPTAAPERRRLAGGDARAPWASMAPRAIISGVMIGRAMVAQAR